MRDKREGISRKIKRISMFGGYLPYGNCFTGPTEKDLDFYRGVSFRAIIFGEWEKDEILFLLENKENAIRAINPRGDTTVVYCPQERLDELVEILKEKFGKLTFGEINNFRSEFNGCSFIAVDNEGHILIFEHNREDGGHFVMHCK